MLRRMSSGRALMRSFPPSSEVAAGREAAGEDGVSGRQEYSAARMSFKPMAPGDGDGDGRGSESANGGQRRADQCREGSGRSRAEEVFIVSAGSDTC